MAQITDDIEEAFDMGKVTRAVFLDITAAYDTVWLTGLHPKIQKATVCYIMQINNDTDLIMNLLYNQLLILFEGGKATGSKPYKL